MSNFHPKQSCRVSFVALFFLLLLLPHATYAQTTYDFTTAIPSGVTSSNVTVSGAALTLSTDSTGDFISEGYFDIAVTNADVGGKVLRLDADRADSIVSGDMQGVTSAKPRWRWASALTLDEWLSSGANSGYTPTFPTATDGGTSAAISSTGSLFQVFPIVPGGDYRLKFNANVSALTDNNLFYLSLIFYDGNFKTLTTRALSDGSLINGLNNYKNYSNTKGAFSENIRLRMPDCDDQTLYVGGSGNAPDDVIRNQCEDDTGNSLTTDEDDNSLTSDGTAYSESDIRYASIAFTSNEATTGTVTLDDVSVDYEQQLELEVLASDNSVLQNSTLDSGFYVEPNSNIANLRVYLRPARDDAAPSIRSLVVEDAADVAVTIGAATATFTENRLGSTVGMPPLHEWYDRDTTRTECLDPFDGNAALNCWEFLAKYGFSRMRYGLPLTYLNTEFASDNITYSFSFVDGVRANHDEAITMLKHFKEAKDYGMDLMFIAENDYADVIWDSTTGLLNDDYDPTPSDDDDDAAQSIDLVAAVTKYLAEEFSGGKTNLFTNADHSTTSVDLPEVDYWQVFVETNISEPQWVMNLSNSDNALLLTNTANAVHLGNPLAITETSLNPHGQLFDTDYLEPLWPSVDANSYDRFNFNTFNDASDIQPEDFVSAWDSLRDESYMLNWKDKSLSIGADAYGHGVYDPYCDIHGAYAEPVVINDTWGRDYGESRQQKLVARWALTSLGMNTDDIYYFVPFPNDGWKGGNIQYDQCWKSKATPSLFSRVSGTGILEGLVDDAAHPAGLYADGTAPDVNAGSATQYEVNDAGLALMTVSKYVSASSPHSAEVTAAPDNAGERYYSTALETADGKHYLGLWFYRPGHYGTAYMDYVSSYADNGFTDRRTHDVELLGWKGVTAATLIHLDGSADESLVVTSDACGHSVVKNVLYGELPVLISLDGASEDTSATTRCSETDTDSDGVMDDVDNCRIIPNVKQADRDGDGVGDMCDDSDGDGVTDATDCNPTDPLVSPVASELCSTVYDDNCNGRANENGAADATMYYRDADRDAYGISTEVVKACVKPPFKFATVSGDCNDANAIIHPGRNEVCDGVDNNCDGTVDEPSRYSTNTYYPDVDGDHHGDMTKPYKACSLPTGYSTLKTDCLDTNPTVYLGAHEICGDLIDNDCDKSVDEGCTMTTSPKKTLPIKTKIHI